MSDFYQGLCTVVKLADYKNNGKNGLFGIYRNDGSVLTKAEWRTLGEKENYNAAWNAADNHVYYGMPVFSNGVMKVQAADGLWGYMKKDGSFLAEPVYEEMTGFSEGLCAVKKDGLWGYIGTDGAVAIQPLYSEAYDFRLGFAEVCLPGTGWQVIDKSGSLLYFVNEQYKYDYEKAVEMMAAEEYAEARDLLLTLEGYSDSNALAAECQDKLFGKQYAEAESMMAAGGYMKAAAVFDALGEYKESKAKAESCREKQYEAAQMLFDAGKYEEAHTSFEIFGEYKDSKKMAEDSAKEQDYVAAKQLLAVGNYETALSAFEKLGDYKDAADIIMSDENLQKLCWTPGHYVRFGAYEQDGNMANGKEPVEWLVLDKKDNRALLISRYALDCRQYNKEYSITWEKSTVRKWLNNEFLKDCFSADEQKRIMSTNVPADKNPSYNTNPGNATKDKVFLLSIPEVKKYFSSDSARQCSPTEYAKKQGVYVASDGNVRWWLRSPGINSDRAADVLSDGSVSGNGDFVDFDSRAVRPALWVQIP